MYIYFFRPGLGMAVCRFAKIFSRLHFCRNFRGLDFLSIGYIDPSDYWETWFLIETFKIRLWDWETICSSFWSSWKEPFICQCLRWNPLISFFTYIYLTICHNLFSNPRWTCQAYFSRIFKSSLQESWMFELKIFITLYGGEYITQEMRVLIVYIIEI